MTTGGSFHDPRMRGFRSRVSVESVLAMIELRVKCLGPETIELSDSAGRVLADEGTAGLSGPSFDRASMDGYALRGEQTFGADTYNPIPFSLIGRVQPDREPAHPVGPCQ